jgi:hypothetical protein
MAGSTISGGGNGTGSRKAGSKKNHSNPSNHANDPSPASGSGNGNSHGAGGNGSVGPAHSNTYRVTISVRKIQANVYASEGGRLSELAVRNWLRSVGFHPEADGRTWLADVESISRLDQSEIVRSERLHGSAARS